MTANKEKLMKDELIRLKEGNKRFVDRVNNPESFKTCKINIGNVPQEPFATILGCADSRVPVVTLFDQGVGDLFTVRNAGNVAVGSAISSIEYSVDHLKTPLVVILGHTDCGAIKCVINEDDIPPYLSGSLKQIIDLKRSILKEHPEFCRKELEEILTEENVRLSLKMIMESSDIIKKLVENKKLKLIGAVYQLDSGVVKWLD